MVEDQTQELGVDFTHDAMGLSAAGAFQASVLLPEFEEEFDLPAQAQQDEGFGKGQEAGREISDDHGPGG